MDKQVSFFVYSETSLAGPFTEASPPAVLCELAAEYSKSSRQIFEACGGLRIKDYFKNDSTHVRVSYWQSPEGYELWRKNEKTLAYLLARADYQRAKQIVESLEGPFFGALHD